MTYVSQYLSKTEDQCSQAMKQAVKEGFENKMHNLDTMKTIDKAYLSNRESSFQVIVRLGRIFPPVYFVNINLPEERAQVLLPENELMEQPDDKKSNIDRYMERPSATFCNGNYVVLNGFCYAKFLVYYTLVNKSNKNVNLA